MTKAASKKLVMVLFESMAGTGHKLIRIRPKGGEKMEILHRDPYVGQTVLYKEFKKIRTLRSTK